MMHKRDLSVKTVLADLDQIRQSYALGAMNQLKGKIQIFDGMSLNTE